MLDHLSKKIRQYRSRGLNEQNTKSTLIDPMLEALGWNLRDIDEVEREWSYRDGRGSYRIDYALRTEPKGTPALLIEAEALGENLEDFKWWRQVVHYANDCDVGWAVLTDGDRYLIFRADAPGPAHQRLFETVHVSKENRRSQTEDLLALLSKTALADATIDSRWNDWRIMQTGRDLMKRLVSEKDDSLVRLLVKKSDLSRSEALRFLESARDSWLTASETPQTDVECSPESRVGRSATPHPRRRRSRTATKGRDRQASLQRPLRRARRAGSQAAELALPRQPEIARALLQTLLARGGHARPGEKVNGRDLYEELAGRFRLGRDVLEAMRPDGRTPVWRNVVQWARQHLVSSGHIDPSKRGIWKLTAKGRRAAERESR